jgi:predicted Zn-dependent peptidase
VSAAAIDLANGAPRLAVHRFALDSGLDVVIHPDPSATLVAVNVWYRVGSTDERVGTSGFAHLYEHLFKNSLHLGGRKHYEVLREAGSVSANASTSSDRTAYYEVMPPSALDIALWIESDRMGYFLPALTAEPLEAQKRVVRNERRQRYDNAAYGAERFAIAAALYPEGHPQRYLTIGRHEDIEAATLDDVASFYRTWYVPANAQLVVAGPVTPAEGEAAVRRWFGSFPASARPVRPQPERPAIAAPVSIAIDDRFAAIARIHRVWHGPAYGDGDPSALEVLASALVSTGTGPLWKRLVLPGLAVRVSAWFSANRLGGEWHVSADLRAGTDPAEVRAILDDELDRARTGAVDERAIARVTRRREAGALWRLESISNRAQLIHRGLLHDDDPQTLVLDVARDAAVTPATLAAAAHRWLDPGRMVEVETRPGATTPRASAPEGDDVD